MLAELLRLLNTGGLHSMDEVAQRLGVSPALVAQMAESLAQRGYLAPLQDRCQTSCHDCAVAGMCGVHNPAGARLLMLTAKGRRAAG